MAILIHRDPMIKICEDIDLSTQPISDFNEINDQITILDPEYLTLMKLHNSDDVYYILGTLISLAGIYYFVYEIIKKVIG